jgi:sugar-phosphatase
MLRALIFDMDGVLIDSEPFWHEAEMAGFALAGVKLTREDCLATTGLRVDAMVDHWFARQPWTTPSPREIEDTIVRHVIALIRERGALKPGVDSALAFAARAGLRTALASSSSSVVIDAVLDKLGLRPRFEVIHSAETEPYGKPHPGVYIHTAEKLGVRPEECVAFEDSPNGVLAAKAARMGCIAVPEPALQGHRFFAVADAVIGSLAEAGASLERLGVAEPVFDSGGLMPELSEPEIRELVDAVPHWHHMMCFPHGIVSPGAYDPRHLFGLLQLPDLRGLRVLDAGACDGFFSFECERRGAEVVALDHADPDLIGFDAARTIYGSRVEYIQANLYDLTPEQIGTFDIVLFLGVLYHLRHPLLALDRLRPLCRQLLVVESLVCDAGFFIGFESRQPLTSLAPAIADLPLAQFLPVDRFHFDASNKWVPNVAGLCALVQDAMFEPGPAVTWGDRALVHARPVEGSPAGRWVAQDSGRRSRG